MSDVTTFHDDLTGAPVLSYAQGSMLAVLDCALVDGLGAGTVDSLVISGGIATMTRAAGNPLEENMLVEVSGIATPATLNGKHRVLTRSVSHVTFSAAGVADQTATGTIIQKAASLGWAIEYTATNKRVYRSPSGSRMYLRFDESTAARYLRVRSYETMSDVDAGTGPCPLDSQVSGGAYVTKTDATSGTAARKWAIVGDDRGFYLIVCYHSSSPSTGARIDYYGDLLPLFGGADPWAFMVASASGDRGSNVPGGGVDRLSDSPDAWVQRGAYGVGGALATIRTAAISRSYGDSGYTSGWSTGALAYPSAAGELLASPIYAVDNPLYQNRGEYPGAQFAQQYISPYISPREFVDGADNLVGRKLRAFPGGVGGVLLLDVTGPWR